MPAWIKWLTNNSEGIPAYIKIDMATQDTELVKLDEGRICPVKKYNIGLFGGVTIGRVVLM